MDELLYCKVTREDYDFSSYPDFETLLTQDTAPFTPQPIVKPTTSSQPLTQSSVPLSTLTTNRPYNPTSIVFVTTEDHQLLRDNLNLQPPALRKWRLTPVDLEEREKIPPGETFHPKYKCFIKKHLKNQKRLHRELNKLEKSSKKIRMEPPTTSASSTIPYDPEAPAY